MATMLFAACTALLVGALLALRWNVFILLPITFFALLSTAAVGVTTGLPKISTVLAVLVVWAALQFGYLVGAGLPSIKQITRRHAREPNAPGTDLSQNL